MPSTGVFDVGDQRLLALPIRGRADELKEVSALVTSVTHGRGGVLVIEGPPGIGKSRLLTELVAFAEKSGVRTLFGEAFEFQQSVPFFSLFMATLGGDPPIADAEAMRRLGNSADLSYWVVHDLQDAILAAAAHAPLAILLEDIHWADTGTLLALRSLATLGPAAPVLWVLTVRTGAGGPAVQETLSVLRRANAAVVQLAAISSSAVAEMVADAVRANVDTSLLDLAVKAHGNPFLIRELLGGLEEEGRLSRTGGRAVADGAELPRRLGASMQQRLDLLSPAAAEVVRIAAVLPDRFSAGLLAAMLERQPASLVSALAEAVRADLLVEDGEHLRFGHDLLREATRQSLPQSLCRAMERQAASVMLTHGADAAEVASQLARSADPGDKEAIAALRQAAQSVSRSDANAAADLSKRAMELLPPGDAEHGRLVAETVELFNRASRYTEAEELAVAALSNVASAEEEAEIRLRRASISNDKNQRRVDENLKALQLRDISEVTRARHLAWLAHNRLYEQRGQQRAATAEAVEAAACTGDPEARIVAGVTLALLDAGDGYPGRALDRLAELCALARTTETATAHLLAAHHYANLLAVIGRLDEAAVQVADGTERARRENNAMATAIWAAFGGIVHLAAGRLAAGRAAAESLPPSAQLPATTELGMVRTLILAEVAMHTDDRNLLQHMVADAHDAYSNGSSKVRRGAAYLLALAAWQRDDVHDATRWLGGDTRVLSTPLVHQVIDRVILSARVASAAGDAGLRASVLRATEVLGRDHPPMPLFTAVAGYARGLIERDADALLAAADTLRSLSRPFLYAAAAEDAGAQLILDERRDGALDQLNLAFDTYSRLEALADARRVGRELRRLGVERRIVSQPRDKTGWDSLTDAELRIVNLIARGATNRDIADQLHLSLHTVKTHVHNTFAKLGINSRTELVEIARSPAEGP